MSRRRIIWLTILALMLIGWWNRQLDFVGFLLLLFVGVSLVKMFDPDKDVDNLSSDDVIQVRRRAIEQLRNSLLRHHNSRGTDREYQASAAAKETTEILQVLNGYLAKKPRRLQARS